MHFDLPLSRGTIDAMPSVREWIDPVELAQTGESPGHALPESIVKVHTFLVGANGHVAVERMDSAGGEVAGTAGRSLYRPVGSQLSDAIGMSNEAYFIGAVENVGAPGSQQTADTDTSANTHREKAAQIALVIPVEVIESDGETGRQNTSSGNGGGHHQRHAAGQHISDAASPNREESAYEPPYEWLPLRHVAHLLNEDESALAVHAVALAAWHKNYQFCSRCGQRVHSILAGWACACTGCGFIEYPRHDPAIIVRVDDAQDKTLLAHNVLWRKGLVSLVAGYVEAGEPPERTVLRELEEEVQIHVDELEFFGSQPWPFPRSQMLGYVAKIHETDRCPIPDGTEIEWARFYSREELRTALVNGEISLPGPSSIASAMLRDWYGGELPTASS